MELYFRIALIIISIVLIVLVMLQTRGSGLGSMFGGDGGVYRTKRGMESALFNMTILFSALFLLVSLLTVLLGA